MTPRQEYYKTWATENKDKIKDAQQRYKERHPEKMKQRAKDQKNTPNGRAQRLYQGAKARARKLGVDFDLDLEQIKELVRNGKCEVSGIDFVLQEGRHPFAPSLDRIDPLKGYTQDNIQVVAWIYNAAKGIGTHDDVLKLAQALTDG